MEVTITKGIAPRGTDSARVIGVIETKSIRGTGVGDDICREVTQYWSIDGELLAENDEKAIYCETQEGD